MQYYTFDRSQDLDLALVATAALAEPHYRPLADAPHQGRKVDVAYLRQMHTVANGVLDGLAARQVRPLEASRWEKLGAGG